MIKNNEDKEKSLFKASLNILIDLLEENSTMSFAYEKTNSKS